MTRPRHAMLIGAERVPGRAGRTLPATDPYDASVIATIPDAAPADVHAAVSAAQAAFDGWRTVSGLDRARLMHRLADVMERDAQRLGEMESRDNGKLVRGTVAQAWFSARTYRYFAGYADKLFGKSIPLDDLDKLNYTLREPVGVAALITAWNSPMRLLANKLAPALAAGCCVVVKPSEHASLTTLDMADLLEEAGFPAGVVNIVSGGAEAGQALVSHPGLGRISFTGSVPTGQAIAAAASRALVPVTLELGGKSPNIVFDDADLDLAATGAVSGIFAAGGQTCIAGSRLLVERTVYDAMVSRIIALTSRIRLGDPMSPQTHMGPVANEPQLTRVREMIAAGQQGGAVVVSGTEPLGPISAKASSCGRPCSPTSIRRRESLKRRSSGRSSASSPSPPKTKP